ncbi:CDC37_C domain-containing protein [Caenorhabditis elegans]|uniref:CDC37_C domain-containing protein n=1 Tax=Caenorhabditis elegans TaxID=6239 RepID=O62188_CAEEL|nr:CDC37_C domain-containing protein [Caenorhabditis elegans]CAB04222.2 CDC37_C domain-containing protein [Caenorhabditis elegans]|eukprot:NP_510614.2 Uncharacterized protein CELE_F31B9.3 [Caenorhabditis elegans]
MDKSNEAGRCDVPAMSIEEMLPQCVDMYVDFPDGQRMPVDEFVKQYAPGPSFYNRLCNMVAETELMREYNDEERRKYEENEHKSRMQKKERKELLEQLLAAGSTDTELIKDTKKRLETITKEQEEEEFDPSVPGPSTL